MVTVCHSCYNSSPALTMPPAQVVRRARDTNNSAAAIIHAIRGRRHAIHAASIVAVFFVDSALRLEQPSPIPMHTSILTGQRWLDELLNTRNPQRCFNQLGMYPASFCLLHWELVMNGGLTSGRAVSAAEQTAIFVYWMVHGSSQRELMERFQHSGDTISKYTSIVLNVIVDSFYSKYIQDPADEIP